MRLAVELVSLFRRVSAYIGTLICFAFMQSALGQAPPAGTTGDPPFATIDGLSPYESVNLANLGVSLKVPIRQKTGAIPLDFVITGTAAVYKVTNSYGSYWESALDGLLRNGSGSNTGGMRAHSSPGVLDVGLSYTITWQTGCGSLTGQFAYFSNFTWEDETGAVHPFPGTLKVNTCSPSTQSGTSTDASGFTVSVTTQKGPGSSMTTQVWDRSGNNLAFATVTDPNGNTVSSLYSSNGITVTDSLGQTVLSASSDSNGNWHYSYTDAANGSRTFAVTYQQLTIDPGACGSGTTVTRPLPVSIGLPDGTSLGITYMPSPNNSANVTGFIQSLTLPTGAQVTYSYPNGLYCTVNGIILPLTVTRTTPDGQWTYSFTPPATGSVTSNTTVVDAMNNETDYSFSGAGYEVQRLIYSGCLSSAPGCTSTSGRTLLKTMLTCYNGNSTNCASTSVFTPITERDVYTTPAGMSTSAVMKTFYDTYGNVTEAQAYDFGGSSAVMDTTVTYAISGSGSCSSIGSHIHDRPCSVVFKNSAGVVVAQTNYSYDANGNRLSSSRLVSGSSYLTSSAIYNANGTVNVATDVNGAQTIYSYNGTGGCNNLLPTSISEPLSLSRSLTWDCNAAVVTSSTDENNQPTTYKYVVNSASDPFWRVLSVTDPLQNVRSFTYTPANGSQPATIESALTFTSSISETLKTFDSMGRIHIVQHRQGPSATNYDSVETDYDADGRVSRITLPYSGAKSATNSTVVSTTYSYDALDRPLTVKDPAGATVTLQYTGRDVLRTGGPASSGDGVFSRQMQYDGLGRLLSVCEITAGTSAFPGGACGQDSPQTGYLTAYAYDALGHLTGVTQNAQSSTTQTRSFAFDGLGRLNSELNPETGQNAPGSTAYTYDSDPSAACAGTFNGDAVKRVDNAGDVTCYAYDALHRATGITYPSGPKAGSTKKKTFVYDTTTFSCPNGANVAGRLAKAYTGSTSVSTGYCYSPRGEITDVYQSTPHSGGYAHFSVSYWPNGQLDVLSGFPGNLPSFTYGPDGEGRPKTVSASSGQNPVTATAYNPAQQVTSVTFGSGDNDVFSINSGRMTRYTYNVNGSAVAGTLNWNTNGTLKSVGITDPLNSADAQTCTYHYDDLVRVSSVGCGTPWSQTFSYDPFGNVTKSGSSSWMPGYSSATNHYTLSGSSYDANGNLTNDTFNTYAWDAEGEMITLNGSTTNTFDAFGRIAETGTSTGPWTQFLYLPGGSRVLATMSNATTLQKAFVPLPAGGQAVYNSSTLGYYRHPDWLGSSRMATTPSRTVYFDGAYAPFGESYATTGTTDLMFAGHTQDVVAGGLYDTLNRKYHAAQGRWTSPDPAGLGSLDSSNPQSWNRYAYVANYALLATDPSGLDSIHHNRKWICMADCPSPYESFGRCSADGAPINCRMLGGLGDNLAISAGGVQIPIDRSGLFSTTTFSYYPCSSGDCKVTETIKIDLTDPNCEIRPCVKAVPVPPPPIGRITAVPSWSERVKDAFSCLVAPDAVNDIKDLSAQQKQQSPQDEGHPEGGGAIWVVNINTQRNGGQAIVGNQNAASGAAGAALTADYTRSAGTCLTK